MVGCSYLVRFEQYQTTEGKSGMQKWCSMRALPRTVSTEALSIQVETKARRTIAPVTWWKSGLDQTSGRTTDGQLVTPLDDAIGVWYAWLSSITGHHKFLAGAHEFFGVVGIEYLNLAIPHKLLNTMHDMCCCFGGNRK